MKWIYNPIKVFAVVFGLVGLIFLMASCLEPNREFEQAQETKQAIQVVNHNETAKSTSGYLKPCYDWIGALTKSSDT